VKHDAPHPIAVFTKISYRLSSPRRYVADAAVQERKMINFHPHKRHPVMNTQKYHRDIEAIKAETTERLRQEIALRKKEPWLLSPAVTEWCAERVKEREEDAKNG
jgi:hypothetical protein